MEENNNNGIPWWQDVENSAWFQYDWNLRNGDLVSQAAYPGRSQFSEWSQQMIATMYQNWYNSAPEQMKRAMQAGINPFVAASGIAGSDTGSVASAPTPANNTLPSMIDAAAHGVSALGGAVGNFASAYIGLRKLRHEIRNIDADTEQTFVEMGFSKLQSKALTTQLKYLDQKEQIGVWQALANFDKTKAEYSNLVANHRNIMADYDRILAQKDLLIAQKGEVTALEELHKAEQARAEELTRFATQEREFFEAHGYKLGTPIYESLRDMMVSNGTFDLQKFGDEVSGYDGKIAAAKEDARASASWKMRPSNAVELAAQTANNILNGSTWWQRLIKQGIQNYKDAAPQLAKSREFDEDYREYKNDLYSIYKEKKREYNRIKRGNPQAAADAKRRMENAYQEYENCTKETYFNSILAEMSKFE